MRRVKFALPFALCLAFATSACNTIENRRSFYAPKKADGPYTRALEDGSWEEQKTVDQQYEEAKRLRRQPKVIPAAPKPAAAPSVEGL
jgi:hypothetical protein